MFLLCRTEKPLTRITGALPASFGMLASSWHLGSKAEKNSINITGFLTEMGSLRYHYAATELIGELTVELGKHSSALHS